MVATGDGVASVVRKANSAAIPSPITAPARSAPTVDDSAAYVPLPAHAAGGDHRERVAESASHKKSHKKSHKSGKKSDKHKSSHKSASSGNHKARHRDSGQQSAASATTAQSSAMDVGTPSSAEWQVYHEMQGLKALSPVYVALPAEDESAGSAAKKQALQYTTLEIEPEAARARARPPPPAAEDDDDLFAKPTRTMKRPPTPSGADEDETVPAVLETVSSAMYKAHFARGGGKGAASAQAKDEFAQLHKIPFASVTINFDDKLGKGEYGVVYSGTWAGNKIAVKELSGGSDANADARQQFMREVKLMQEIGEHPFVLRAFGATRNDTSSYLLLEFAAHGSLHSVLRADNVDLDRATIIRMAYEIASGMAHLHDNARIIHRDLACRNVLVTEDGHMKIADFGLSRAAVAGAGTLANDKSRRFPIKWLAPETLAHGTFSAKSDVWSYGILLWEIWNGCEPFANLTTKEVVRRAIAEPDFQPHVAPSIPAVLRHLLNECFDHDPSKRPQFAEIAQRLKETMASDAKRLAATASKA